MREREQAPSSRGAVLLAVEQGVAGQADFTDFHGALMNVGFHATCAIVANADGEAGVRQHVFSHGIADGASGTWLKSWIT